MGRFVIVVDRVCLFFNHERKLSNVFVVTHMLQYFNKIENVKLQQTCHRKSAFSDISNVIDKASDKSTEKE